MKKQTKIFKTLLLLTLLLIISSQLSLAISGNMKLLTVTKINDEITQGNTADLFLEIVSGQGRVFIDSYPLSKLDTQSSTRYAQKTACEFTDKNCEKYDFLYTIRADAALVGGPSAGAAIAILTTSLLKNEPLRDDAVITGTINSGGIIGPVGGTYEKALAAQKAGYKYLLISDLSLQENITKMDSKEDVSKVISQSENKTVKKIIISEEPYSEPNSEPNQKPNSEVNKSQKRLSDLKITVIRVSTLAEAYAFMTKKEYQENYSEVTPNKDYLDIMTKIKNGLCARSEKLYEELETNITLNNKTNIEDPYSLASLCYSDLLQLRNVEFSQLTKSELFDKKIEFKKTINDLEISLNKKELTTLAELETYLIVKERISEADYILDQIKINATDEELSSGLSFVAERLNSANEWSNFFEMNSPDLDLNQETLKLACQSSLGEATERISYLAIYLPTTMLEPLYTKLTDAQISENTEDYAFCIFQAVKIKAEANMLLAGVFTDQERISTFIDKKLMITSLVINNEIEKNHFPIAGYSYYKYADTLRERNPYSAMLFSEYAMELSNLDLYFPKKKSFSLPANTKLYLIILAIFASGLFIGLGLGMNYEKSDKKPIKNSLKKNSKKKTTKKSGFRKKRTNSKKK